MKSSTHTVMSFTERACVLALSAAVALGSLGMAGCGTSAEQADSDAAKTAEQAKPQDTAGDTASTTDQTAEDVEEQVEQAAPSMAAEDELSGWFQGILWYESSSEMPTITAGSLDGDTLTLEGTLSAWDADNWAAAGDSSLWLEGPFTLRVDQNTQWLSSGGDQGSLSVDADYVRQILANPSGLGLILELDHGYVVSATIAS